MYIGINGRTLQAGEGVQGERRRRPEREKQAAVTSAAGVPPAKGAVSLPSQKRKYSEEVYESALHPGAEAHLRRAVHGS